MKFGFFSILALVGLILSSCVSDDIPSNEGSILAVMENDNTRTAVTDEGSFTWTEDDKVWLHTTSGSVVGILSSGANTSSAKFSFGSHFGEITGKAVYPYNYGHSISGDTLNVVMPASYNLGSSRNNTNAVMYGINSDGTLKFSHMAGVMRFVLKNVPAGVNSFTITLDKKINGTFTADLTEDYPVIETSSTTKSSEKTITLNFHTLTNTSDISLYVPLPIGTYCTLELGLYSYGKPVWTYSNTVTNTISRKSLSLMPVVSLDGDAETENFIDYVDEYGENHGPGVKVGETVWAPVNCGYHKTDYPWGKLYQWGRKYGQGYSGQLYDLDGNEIGTYSDASVPELVSGPVVLTAGQAKENENKFYYNKYGYWCKSQDDNLWNSGTESYPVKTDYDPCPTGWRVPTKTELEELTSNYSARTINEHGFVGYWLSGPLSYSSSVPQVFFPNAGYRDSDGKDLARGSSGRYWTSRPTGSRAYSLALTSFFCFSTERARGKSVRCVREY